MSVNPPRDDAGRDPGGPRIHELVKLEFEHVTSQFTANEEMGEKRVALFVSLTAGLGAAAVLAGDKLGPAQALSSSGIFIAVNVAWLLFGYLTFLRIVQRNVTTDRYKAQLRQLPGGSSRKSTGAPGRCSPTTPTARPTRSAPG
jgi:hypothetical protein